MQASTVPPILTTKLGQLHEIDCLAMLKGIPADTVDLAFADPPFNLGKEYSSKINDKKTEAEYLDWCKTWLDEMIRTLKPGGSLFLWNLPKWNIPLGAHLGQKLNFRHWIAVDIKYSLPIFNRLYPSHYSLLYYVKGERPAIFHPDRTPIICCRHCGGELRDYGGYKNKMNPHGVNLADVWTDIPPVRHAKYKKRAANALPLKLMDRIISMASDRGSLVLDPFGGSGTTYVAAELTGRRWIGSELDCSAISERFASLQADREHLAEIQASKNILFRTEDLARQKKSGRTLSKDYRLTEEDDCECDQPDTVQPSLFASS
ncbi:site-specific DNA-methyltransferase [Duganella sp. FT94W]|uniref:Methyltransferase n=1 Tax=Duganella lactea TaxID=2692173 RepID=A0ABW9V9P1_9BURK|nr:site-specific DNA-methyltransferase [Duganella lactea]MYM35467.1 site-specific DNA-methyltransferase [Duganella lactea]